MEKLLSCGQIPSKTTPMNPLVSHILHFLKGEGQTSLQDLAAAVGCVSDEDDLIVTSNVDLIMKHLVHAMMSCSDYKVRDMGHRQELKFVVEKKVYGCPHRPSDEIIKHSDYAVTLRLKDFGGGNLSAIQNALDNSLKSSSKHPCDQCNQDSMLKNNIAIRTKSYIQPFCDPDFLTIFFDVPRNLLESDLILQCGESTYAVKVVTHWDRERQKSSVSVQRSDGWWWHGTDMEQASQYKYREKQISFCNPISNAIVLMCVRVVPYADFEGSDDDMEEGPLDIEDGDEEMNIVNKDVGDIETVGMCNILGGDQDNRRNEGVGCEGSSDPNLLYDYEAALIESRRANPDLKTQAEMVDIGIRCMGSFGVGCLRPEPDDYTPMDGDCLWTCYAKSRNPSMVGAPLRAEVFYYRVRCVGAAIEDIKNMDEERLAMVQSVIANAEVGVPPQSREEIVVHLTRYLESGTWNGKMGDILPYVAAAFLNQGLLIINLDVNTISYAAPECKMFHGKEDFKVPCAAARQENHFERVPIKQESWEAAAGLYEMLKNGQHLNLQAEVGEINDRQSEPDQTSTPLRQEAGSNEQSREGHSVSGTSRSLLEERDEHIQSSLASTRGAEMDMHRSQVVNLN